MMSVSGVAALKSATGTLMDWVAWTLKDVSQSSVSVPEEEVRVPPPEAGWKTKALTVVPLTTAMLPEATLRRLPAGMKTSRSPA